MPTHMMFYQRRLNTEDCDRKLANALLYILVSGMAEGLDQDTDSDALSHQIQHECSLRKNMSDLLAFILVSLYSEDNCRDR